MLPCFSILEQPIDDLFKAIEKGDVETVEKLISKGVSLNVHGGSLNVTPLHYSASTNNAKLAELLITNKADIDARDEDNQTPLHTAAYNNSSEVAEVLLKKKSKLQSKGCRWRDTSSHCHCRQQQRSDKSIIKLWSRHRGKG